MTFLDALRDMQKHYERQQSLSEDDIGIVVNGALADLCKQLLDRAADAVPGKIPPPTPVAAAILTGEEPLWFGKHRGTKLKDVPIDYWQWMRGQPEPIKHPGLRAYVEQRLKPAALKPVVIPPPEPDPDGIPF